MLKSKALFEKKKKAYLCSKIIVFQTRPSHFCCSVGGIISISPRMKHHQESLFLVCGMLERWCPTSSLFAVIIHISNQKPSENHLYSAWKEGINKQLSIHLAHINSQPRNWHAEPFKKQVLKRWHRNREDKWQLAWPRGTSWGCVKCPSKMLRVELGPLGPVAGHRPGGGNLWSCSQVLF